MKNNICIYFLALGAMICSINSRINAQEANRDIAGIYNTGGVGLIVAPDSIFAIAAMGTLEFGTWDVYKNYLILEPAGNLFPERFYVTAVYNAERVDIEVEFRDLSDVNGHYSFDNEELKEEMKPGYSAYSFFRLTENFPSGTHRTLQLSQKSYWDTLQENEALTYNFILPEEYNEFTVHVIEETPNLTYPFLLTIEEDALSIEGQELPMYARYNELDDEEIGLMAMVSGFLKDRADPDYFSLNYPGEGVAIPYEWKGPRTVKFDVRHMEDIDFDYGDGTLLDYIED